jgi:hypothetical protein
MTSAPQTRYAEAHETDPVGFYAQKMRLIYDKHDFKHRTLFYSTQTIIAFARLQQEG